MTPDPLPMKATGTDADPAARVDLALERDFRLGDMAVSPSSREVRLGERRELLEPRIMQVLVRLARTPGQVVSRDALIGCCWEGRIVSDDAINRVIARLRRLSELDAGASFTIETIARVGYRLWPDKPEPVEVAVPAPPPPLAFAPPVIDVAPLQDPPRSETLKRRLRRGPAIAAVVLSLGLGAVVVAARAGRGAPEDTVTALAVLPFDDLSTGRDQAYFAEGVAEEIQGALAGEPGLRVIGRTSARRFKENGDLRELGRDLNVSHVLEGSVRADAGQLRMNVRLVRTADGEQVWAQEYRRPAADVFGVQEEISTAVARSLRGRFALPARRAEEPRTELEAYDLVLAARARLREPRAADLEAANALLRRAVEVDADYGPAWAMLAQAVLKSSDKLGGHGRIPVTEAEAAAERYARRAIALAPDQAEGHAALARVTPVPEALGHIERAVRLDPSQADLRVTYADVLDKAGRFEDTISQLRTAVTIDPLHGTAHLLLADRLSTVGRSAEAEAAAARYSALHKRPVETAMLRAHIAADRGDWSETIRLIEWAHGRKDGFLRADMLGMAYRVLELRERARVLDDFTSQPFDARFYARDEARALALALAADDTIWEPSRSAFAALTLRKAGQDRALVEVIDRRYGGASRFCAGGDMTPAAEFAAALRTTGRARDADIVLDCAEASIRAELRSGLYRGQNGVRLAEISMMRNRRGEALAQLERAFADGFRGQYVSADLLEHSGLRPLAGDGRFKALQERLDRHVARERREVDALGPPPPILTRAL